MKKLFRFLWTGTWHEHHWEVYEKRGLVDKNNNLIGDKFILRCKTCGKMKAFRTY